MDEKKILDICNRFYDYASNVFEEPHYRPIKRLLDGLLSVDTITNNADALSYVLYMLTESPRFLLATRIDNLHNTIDGLAKGGLKLNESLRDALNLSEEAVAEMLKTEYDVKWLLDKTSAVTKNNDQVQVNHMSEIFNEFLSKKISITAKAILLHLFFLSCAEGAIENFFNQTDCQDNKCNECRHSNECFINANIKVGNA